jgi:hypothetical protein
MTGPFRDDFAHQDDAELNLLFLCEYSIQESLPVMNIV